MADHWKTFSGTMESRFSSEIIGRIENNKAAIYNFQKRYLSWNKARTSTILELNQLVKDVHTDQLVYNERSIFLKEINVKSRVFRTEFFVFGFFGSIGAAVTEAVSAVNYFQQAWNIDDYMEKFNTIMDKEIEITKLLYEARSNCFKSYKDVEVVVQRYHSDAFGSVLNNITQSVTEDVWPELKSALCGDSTTDMITRVDEFFTKMSKADVFIKMYRAIEDYIQSNPAVLDAIESTEIACIDIYDAFTPNILGGIFNIILIEAKQSEIWRLQKLVNDPKAHQSKLESKIRKTIMVFENEAKEMEDLYKSLLTVCRRR